MHPLIRRCCGGAVAAASLLGASSIALADGPPVARAVLKKDLTTGKITGSFDKEIPSGQAFIVELKLNGLPRKVDGDPIGSVKVWPSEETNGCATIPATGEGIDQYHEFAMTVTGQGQDAALRAEIPALQIGQEFCFDFKVDQRPSSTTIQQIADLAARQLEAPLMAHCGDQTTMDQIFQTELNNAANKVGLKGTVRLESAGRAKVKYLLKGMDLCVEAVDRETEIRTISTVLKPKLTKRHDGLITNLISLNVPRGLLVPMFGDDGGSTVPIGELLRKNIEAPKLAAAITQLKQRGAALTGAHHAWIQVLEDFQRELPTDADKALLKAQEAVKKIPAVSVPELWLGGKFITLADLQAAYKSGAGVPNHEPAKLYAQIRQMQRVYDPKTNPQLDPWAEVFRDLGEVEADDKAADKSLKEAQTSAGTAKKTLHERLVEAMSIEDVRHDIQEEVVSAFQTSGTGTAKTPAVANIASVDVGIAFALPSGGTERKLWALPYLGVNLYTTRVDRTIALDQLVGPWFRQRISLTLGMTLSDPTLPSRTVKPVFQSIYPVVGVGWRVSKYARVTVGGVFYQLADKNPASTASSLQFAPFLSGSLDADVMYFISEARKRNSL